MACYAIDVVLNADQATIVVAPQTCHRDAQWVSCLELCVACLLIVPSGGGRRDFQSLRGSWTWRNRDPHATQTGGAARGAVAADEFMSTIVAPTQRSAMQCTAGNFPDLGFKRPARFAVFGGWKKLEESYDNWGLKRWMKTEVRHLRLKAL